MRTAEVQLFKFNELSDMAKERAINKCRESEHYMNYNWYEYIFDDFKEEVKKYFDIDKIYFSGFWSQGDGAMFEYSGINKELINEFWNTLKVSPLRLQWLKSQVLLSGSGKHRGFYYHENSCEHSLCYELNSTHAENLDNFSQFCYSFNDTFEEFIINKYKDICIDLYNMLESGYENMTSDEVVAEHLEINEYEFDIYGNIQ